jgi:hypothetical protein
MNDNTPPKDKVKYENVLPFPGCSVREESSPRLETDVAELKSMVVSLLAIIAGRESRPEIKAPVEAPKAPESRPLPEEDKTISRLALCNELVRLLIELGKEIPLGASPKLFAGEKKGKPRVYLAEDNSYLYFDRWGRLVLGEAKMGKRTVAQRVLNQLYAMRDYLPSPIIQAALLKSQFNAVPE